MTDASHGARSAPAPRALDDALATMRDLRTRCEWDRVQTHQSLRPYLIEEAHEVDDAIAALADGGDAGTLRDELGDLLLQVLFHAVIAEERGAFTMLDVAGALVAKMHVRHPHLYGAMVGGERPNWEAMKAAAHPRRALDEGLPRGLPALHRAQRLQDRAAGVGFDWSDARGPLAKVREECDEVAALLNADAASPEQLTVELGDLLFAVVNVCRKAGVHAALALDAANAKFARRYAAMDALARAEGVELRALPLDAQDRYWDRVKAQESQTASARE
jgi:MazG family protein